VSEKGKKKPSQVARSVRALAILFVLAAGLAGFNAYTSRQDVLTATGEPTPRQEQFFREAADRPDIEPFFKGMNAAQRLAMARNLSKHDDPKMAELIGKLLTTFDGAAREELGKALIRLAPTDPESIAKQLKLGSSFQRLAVYKALDVAGPKALPFVAEQIKDGAARVNAANYLVDKKESAIPLLLPHLDSKDKDIRLAAAEALGKVRAREALPKFLALYKSAADDEPLQYLSAIAAIGAPESEAFLTEASKNEGIPSPFRAQCLLGLGRIASTSAERTLWTFTESPDLVLAESSIPGLQLIGDRALVGPGAAVDRVKFAAGIESPLADRVIQSALASETTRVVAAQAAEGRTSLVTSLVAALKTPAASQDGLFADALATALASTEVGRDRLKQFVDNPLLGGLVKRRLALS